MARTVADAAMLLGVLEGRAPDRHDPAPKACPRVPNGDYTRFLNPQGLAGARLGLARSGFVDEARHGEVVSEAIAVLRQHGAIVVDPVDVPPAPPCAAITAGVRGKDTELFDRLQVWDEARLQRDGWLAGPGSPVKTLTELREWNLAHRAEGAIKYGQAQLDISDEVDLERDRARYLADRAADVRLTGAEGIDAAMKRDRLDAMLSSSGRRARQWRPSQGIRP